MTMPIRALIVPPTVFDARALATSVRLELLTDTLALHKAASSAYLPNGRSHTRFPLAARFSPFTPDYNPEGDRAFPKVVSAFAAMGQATWFNAEVAMAATLGSKKAFEGFFAQKMRPLRYVFDAALVDAVTGKMPTSVHEAYTAEHRALLENNTLREALLAGLISFSGASIFVGGLQQRLIYAHHRIEQQHRANMESENRKSSIDAALTFGIFYYFFSPFLTQTFGFDPSASETLMQSLVVAVGVKLFSQHYLRSKSLLTGESAATEGLEHCARMQDSLLGMHRTHQVTGVYRDSPGMKLGRDEQGMPNTLALHPSYYRQPDPDHEVVVEDGLYLREDEAQG